jgi:hypothetical protein
VQFSVQDNATVTFGCATPIPPSLGGSTTDLSLIATNSNNLSNHVNFNVSIAKPANTHVTATIVGSTLGGLAVLTGSIFGIWRYRQSVNDAKTRESRPFAFANYLRTELKLIGVDNFESDEGKDYLEVTRDLKDALKLKRELQLTDGIDSMPIEQMKMLVSRYVAPVIQGSNGILSSAGFFYRSNKMNCSELRGRANIIAEQVASRYRQNQSEQQIQRQADEETSLLTF